MNSLHKLVNNTSKDIIVFTMHKSASMFIREVCAYLCQIGGIPHHQPNNRNSELNVRNLLINKSVWQSRRGCFAPVRFYIDVPHLDDYEIILHLRDPRDVLVSMYYSYCFIHKGPTEGNTGHRKSVADGGIDAFVLTQARESQAEYEGDYGTGSHVQDLTGNIVDKYNDYINNLLPRKNVTFVTYEEMVTNFQHWLEKFIEAFPIQDKRSTIEQLVKQAPTFFPERTQDTMTHKRRITPGDHKNKLKPETIEELNTIFGDILDALGYEK